MKTVRWKPLPADIMGAARELAMQLRLLVDRAGLTLRQLAADDRVPHNVSALRRFFSGRELPPPGLIEVIADRCDGDRELLLSTLDRAVAARDAGLPWAAGKAPKRPLRRRPWMIVAVVAGLVVATNALTAVVVAQLTGRSATRSEAAAAEPEPKAPPKAAPNTAPNAAPNTGSKAAPASPNAAQPTPPPLQAGVTSGNLIRNGAFTGSVKSWWAVSDVQIEADADRLRADARGGSTDSWGRIVTAAGFPLQAGRPYTLTFDAAADTDIADRVTVQLDSPPYTAAITRSIKLSTMTRHFSYQFTANVTTEQAALNFELGDHTDDHTIWLDNVALAPA